MWSYVIVLKNPLFTENSHAGQAEAGVGASPAIRSLFVFLFVFHLKLLFEALKASFVTFQSLKDLFVFPSSPHRLRRPAVDLLGALRVRAESLKFLICLQPLKALQTRAESPSPFAWLLTSPEPLYFSTIYKCTRVSNCIILLLANEAHSAPVIDGQFF